MFLDEKNKSIEIYFEEKSKLIAFLIISFEISDEALEIMEISVNDKKINYLEERNDEKILEKIDELIDKKNIIKINLKSYDDIAYENGCLFYKSYKNSIDEEERENIILDEWQKDR